MPITFGYMLQSWEYQYECKNYKKGQSWFAFGHTKNEFDKALVLLNSYEEYYGHGYKLQQTPDHEVEVLPAESKGFKEKAVIVEIDECTNFDWVKECEKSEPKPKVWKDADIDFLKGTLDANASCQLGSEEDQSFYRCIFGMFNKLYRILNPIEHVEEIKEDDPEILEKPKSPGFHQMTIFDF